MAKIIVHGGDFKKGGGHSYGLGSLMMVPPGKIFVEAIPVEKLVSIEMSMQESVKGYSKAVAVAATLISPIGAIAGMSAAGNKTQITFLATLSDGRKMLATTDGATFNKLSGTAMDNQAR